MFSVIERTIFSLTQVCLFLNVLQKNICFNKRDKLFSSKLKGFYYENKKHFICKFIETNEAVFNCFFVGYNRL